MGDQRARHLHGQEDAAREAMATMAMAFATLERRLISERTKTAPAEAQRQGKVLGRPVIMKPATRRRI